jgi:hypothetical protein
VKTRKILEIVCVSVVTALFSFWIPNLFGCSNIPIGSGSVSELGFVSYPNCFETPNVSLSLLPSLSFPLFHEMFLTLPYSPSSSFCSQQYNQMSSLIFNNPETTIRLLFANMTSTNSTGGTTIHELPFSFPTLALFIIVYFGLMTVTAGLSLAGGLFIPNMILGATVGRFIGQTVEVCFPDSGIDSSIYAMIGSAAFVAGSLRLSLSICVIIVELTGGCFHPFLSFFLLRFLHHFTLYRNDILSSPTHLGHHDRKMDW